MIDQQLALELAQRIVDAERTKQPTKQISQLHPHLTIDDAYVIQAVGVRLAEAAGRKVKARKIGLTSKVMQDAVGVHEPDSGVLLSGDHLLGRISLFFDYGHTKDPVGEFLDSLDKVEELDVRLCLSGHGRPFRDADAKIEANRKLVGEQLDRVRGSLKKGEKSAFEVVPDLIGEENLSPGAAAWGLQLALAYIDHLAIRGEVEKVDGTDPVAWRLS